jgi:pyruvate carboxylase
MSKTSHHHVRLQTLLVANRSEIAIRVMRAANEMNIRTVGVYSSEDRFSLHRFKADESYLVGQGKGPLEAYEDIDDLLRIARVSRADAVHPGYGFLARSPEFANRVQEAGLAWVGPSPQVLQALQDLSLVEAAAAQVGIALGLPAGAMHQVDVQLIGDQYGQIVHAYERDCSVKRAKVMVLERAPASFLNDEQRSAVCALASRLGLQLGLSHVAAVSFAFDPTNGKFHFLNVCPHIQIEHTVTEEVTGLDLVKAQILVTEGAQIGRANEQGLAMLPGLTASSPWRSATASAIPAQHAISLRGHALQCRITTEDPDNDFLPDYGRLTAYRSAAGFGIRLDGGTAYTGAVITPYYDPLLVKVTAWAPTSVEAVSRMDRALREFRIRGVSSNLAFVEHLINHPDFLRAPVTTQFIDDNPALVQLPKRRDRATRLLRFMGDVIVNGNPILEGHAKLRLPGLRPALPSTAGYAVSQFEVGGLRKRLHSSGPAALSQWVRQHNKVLLTDTTMRDAQQSLLATRMRTADMLPIADFYRERLDDLFAVECWGGASFDAALRFLKEDPWLRLTQLRQRMPNHLLKMLLRSSNAVGYQHYPANVVTHFIREAAQAGIDVFRVFDAFNNVRSMRSSMEAVVQSGAYCEAAICYTGDIFDPMRSKYDLHYYVRLARELERAGAHAIAIKDMAGVCKPRAAAALVRAIREECGLPLHFHTHDTSGVSAASVLAAVEAGCDVVDAAMDAMSGLTSQPGMGGLVAALEGGPRAPSLDQDALNEVSTYWEAVRMQYSPFEVDMRSGTSDVFRHEMPGGQYTNLREQARSMGLEPRWKEIARAYADVNHLFGDIVKVTPVSKVVGDLALFMVANHLGADDLLDPWREISFPASVQALFRGDMGFPSEGFPVGMTRRVLGNNTTKANAPLLDIDLQAARQQAEKEIGHKLDGQQFASYLMFPKVYKEFAEHQRKYADVSVIPTMTYLHGMQPREEVAIDIDPGKTLVVRLQGQAPSEDEGEVRVFFELNGQPRTVRVQRHLPDGGAGKPTRRRAQAGNVLHLAAPMPGLVHTVAVKTGQRVRRGEALLSLESMKLETQLRADRDGVIAAVHVRVGDKVSAHELLLEYAAS